MNKLNLTLLNAKSLFSCVYSPMFSDFKSWYAYLSRDVIVTAATPPSPLDQYTALSTSKWIVPNDVLASGSGKLSASQKGIYMLTAYLIIQDLDTEVLHISFFHSSEHPVCHMAVSCSSTQSPCNKNIRFSCLAKLSIGNSVDLFSKTKSTSSVKVVTNSERKVNYFGDNIAGMSVTPSFSNTLTTTAQQTNTWQEIGDWSIKNDTFDSLFMEKISTYYNELIFEESGVFHVNLNLMYEVLECANGCTLRYLRISHFTRFF